MQLSKNVAMHGVSSVFSCQDTINRSNCLRFARRVLSLRTCLLLQCAEQFIVLTVLL